MCEIKKGDLIATSKPFAYVLKDGLNTQRCAYCLLRRPELKKCTGCNFAYFCDRPCQKSAWVDHKLECASLKKVLPNIPPPHVMLLARIIRKLRRGGNELSEKIGNISRKFENLMSHAEDILDDRSRCEAFAASSFVLSKFLDESELPAGKDLLELFGKFIINSVCISDECNEIGAGLYLGPSMFDHSCNPNVTFLFSGPTLLVRSLQDFPQFDINKMFVNYVDLIAETEIRSSQLREQYYFTCQCEKCTDEHSDDLMRSFRCVNKDCSRPIYPMDEVCSSCGSVFRGDRRKEAEEISRKLSSLTETLITEINPSKIIERVKDLLEEGRCLLHPSNIHLMKSLHLLFEAFIMARKEEEALKLGLELFPQLRLYFAGNEYLLWNLKRLARLQIDLNQKQAAAKNLTEALKLLTFLYGKQCVHLQLVLSMLRECQ